MKIQILGTEYDVIVKKYDEDGEFKRLSCDGYCDSHCKLIVVCNMATYPGWEFETAEKTILAQKDTLRHEIVHAFLNESGLQHSTANYTGGWAKFEEMIDWIALQSPKMHKAFLDAGAL